MEQIKENNLIWTKRHTGLPYVISPMSVEFKVVNNNSLYNTIIKESKFNDLIEKELNKGIDDLECYTEEHKQKQLNELNKYKQVIRDSKIKITIKIELESYDNF